MPPSRKSRSLRILPLKDRSSNGPERKAAAPVAPKPRHPPPLRLVMPPTAVSGAGQGARPATSTGAAGAQALDSLDGGRTLGGRGGRRRAER
jgi:hypothetical protein